MVMVAVTTVANFEVVGSILVIAMLIVPAAAARLMTDRLGVMIALSLLIAAASAVLGHVLAFYGPTWVGLTVPGTGAPVTANTAPMMTVVAGAILTGAILFSPQYGLIARAYHRLALSYQIARQDILGLLYRWRELAHDSAPMPRREVLAAVGDTFLSRCALRALTWRSEVAGEAVSGAVGLHLTSRGLARAARLVGSHRLWEAYLAKHFQLTADHLHAPAERMEHYISREMREKLREQFTDPSHDPHGRPIPDRQEPQPPSTVR